MNIKQTLKLTQRNRVVQCAITGQEVDLCFHIREARPSYRYVTSIGEIAAVTSNDACRTFDWWRVVDDNAVATYVLIGLPSSSRLCCRYNSTYIIDIAILQLGKLAREYNVTR